jgi:hypothetical protein
MVGNASGFFGSVREINAPCRAAVDQKLPVDQKGATNMSSLLGGEGGMASLMYAASCRSEGTLDKAMQASMDATNGVQAPALGAAPASAAPAVAQAAPAAQGNKWANFAQSAPKAPGSSA